MKTLISSDDDEPDCIDKLVLEKLKAKGKNYNVLLGIEGEERTDLFYRFIKSRMPDVEHQWNIYEIMNMLVQDYREKVKSVAFTFSVERKKSYWFDKDTISRTYDRIKNNPTLAQQPLKDLIHSHDDIREAVTVANNHFKITCRLHNNEEEISAFVKEKWNERRPWKPNTLQTYHATHDEVQKRFGSPMKYSVMMEYLHMPKKEEKVKEIIQHDMTA